jgi:hypothetical protein
MEWNQFLIQIATQNSPLISSVHERVRYSEEVAWETERDHSNDIHLIIVFCCEIWACHSGRVDLRLVEYNSASTAPRRLSDWPINQHSKLKNANIKSSYQSFFIHQLTHKWIVLKTILNFTLKLTLKPLRHVSVQSHHHHRAHYSCLLCDDDVMMWLHICIYMQPHHHTPMYFNWLF